MKHVTPTACFEKLPVILLLAFSAGIGMASAQQTFWLDRVDPNMVELDNNGRTRADRSTRNNQMSIGGQTFTNGLGTRAPAQLILNLEGKADSFSGKVGVDDEVARGTGNVTFKIIGDKKTLYQSPVMHSGDTAREINLSLDGVKLLTLIADDGNNGSEGDDADWVDAKIIGRIEPVAEREPQEKAVILTPPQARTPRINSAKVFGVRPEHPFLFTIAATGDRPMTFAADDLPEGLQLDSISGRITGILKEAGEHTVTLHAKNARGEAQEKFKILCGSQIGLTPAMGWNSWNCFASAVTADKVKAAADAMVKSGLINHGWTYINIDDYWEVKPSATNDPTLQGPQRDSQGFITPNPRFPDMKELTDYVHSKGLKIGLYSSPGPSTCGGCVGSYNHESLDAQEYATWGFDYLKYDWCSYARIVQRETGETRNNYTLDVLKKPYQVMREALDKAPRDIIFSFCQYGMGNVWEWGAEVGGNSWRTTGDIRDTWGSMSGIGFNQAGHEKYSGPGHFNDPDMLVVGMVGWGPKLHPTHLSPNEQYTHISLWCLLDSPLLIGCDMTQLDDFTLSLLTNDEVLEVSQDPLARQAGRVAKDGLLEIWAKDMEDGSKAVGLFNRGRTPAEVTANWSDLGLHGRQKIRDLWRQKDLGKFDDKFEATVPRHGVVLVRISPLD